MTLKIATSLLDVLITKDIGLPMLGYDAPVAILRQNDFHQHMTNERKKALIFIIFLLTEGSDG